MTFREKKKKNIIHHRAAEKHKKKKNIMWICVRRASVVHFYPKDAERLYVKKKKKKTWVLRATVVQLNHRDTE